MIRPESAKTRDMERLPARPSVQDEALDTKDCLYEYLFLKCGTCQLSQQQLQTQWISNPVTLEFCKFLLLT